MEHKRSSNNAQGTLLKMHHAHGNKQNTHNQPTDQPTDRPCQLQLHHEPSAAKPTVGLVRKASSEMSGAMFSKSPGIHCDPDRVDLRHLTANALPL